MRYIVFIVILLMAVPIYPATWYVATTGTDDGAAGRGETVGDPYATIQFAYDNAGFASNDIIEVAAGEYRQGFTFLADINFTLSGATRSTTIITGGVILDAGTDWTQVGATDVWWYQESSTFYNSVWVESLTPYLFSGSYPPSTGESYTSNDTLYIDMGGADPNDSIVEAATASYDGAAAGMILSTANLSGETITFEDLTISGVYGSAVHISNASTNSGTFSMTDVTIRNTVCEDANKAPLNIRTSASSTSTWTFTKPYWMSATNLTNSAAGGFCLINYDGTVSIDSGVVTNIRGASGFGGALLQFGTSSDNDNILNMDNVLFYGNGFSIEQNTNINSFAEFVNIDSCGFVANKAEADGTIAFQGQLDSAVVSYSLFLADSADGATTNPVSACLSSVHPSTDNTPAYNLNNNIFDQCFSGASDGSDGTILRISSASASQCYVRQLGFVDNIVANIPAGGGSALNLCDSTNLDMFAHSGNVMYNNDATEYDWTPCDTGGQTPYGSSTADMYDTSNDDAVSTPDLEATDSLLARLNAAPKNDPDSMHALYIQYWTDRDAGFGGSTPTTVGKIAK